ncbi:MAG TPA: hypothetical protein PKC30_06530 [Saprospiraceae bacterium]|nr:hypothetical protein [Saprospiraceae bacterium]
MKNISITTLGLILIIQASCNMDKKLDQVNHPSNEIFQWVSFDSNGVVADDGLLSKYTPYTLTTDLTHLSENDKSLIRTIMEAGIIMDELFWVQAYGSKNELLEKIQDPTLKAFTVINYGPWDRLAGNRSFISGYDIKPPGANYYPVDMTKEEFEETDLSGKESLYSMIERDSEGRLVNIPYSVKFNIQLRKASSLLKKAADFSENEGLKKYLLLRADALLTDEYQASDKAWLDMKDNTIDVVIGPIENYEDQLFGYKAAFECFILVKDMEWSERLSQYAAFLPSLQKGLPVPDEYKKEQPGTDTELNAYDVIWYSGDCNAGSKTIAINLPNDEEVQLSKGTRRLQLKNTMRAKFDKILLPIADILIHPDQRSLINFNAFFSNTMFHEVAHGLGIKNTINGKGTVRMALKEHYSALEEGKADMLGLYMIKQLFDSGELEGDIQEYIVTFMAGIFRSVRFGASSAHGKANMIRFNYFDEYGAFTRDEEGYYQVHFDRFQAAMNDLSAMILKLQGDGDYEGVDRLVREKGAIKDVLQKDLDRLAELGIPVDIVFRQGTEVLGI